MDAGSHIQQPMSDDMRFAKYEVFPLSRIKDPWVNEQQELVWGLYFAKLGFEEE